MTLKQLQRYLETEKWRETAKRGYDLCGAYARCAHCNRYDEYPCAEAHNRYLASQDFSAEAEGLLPEPSVKRVFGAEVPEEKAAPVQAPAPVNAPAPVKEQPERRESPVINKTEGVRIPIQRLVREKRVVQEPPAAPVVAPVVAEQPIQTPPVEQKTTGRKHVLKHGAGRGVNTRILVLRRK